MFFAVFLLFLTVSLISAADSSNPNDYSSSIWRIPFDTFCLLYISVMTLKEIYKLGRLVKMPRSVRPSSQWNSLLRKLRNEPYLLLKFLAFAFLWAYLLLRVSNRRQQWPVAAVAYLLTVLLTFKYTAVIKLDLYGIEYYSPCVSL